MAMENSNLTIESGRDTITFTFPSTMDHIDEVIIEAIDYLYLKMVNIKKHAFSINLVLREGLTNAVRHGNLSNPEKNVKLLLDVSENPIVKFAIEDQGDGFNWQEAKENDLPEDEDHGRGIIIIDSYFSSYTYNDKGNILFLEKDTSE